MLVWVWNFWTGISAYRIIQMGLKEFGSSILRFSVRSSLATKFKAVDYGRESPECLGLDAKRKGNTELDDERSGQLAESFFEGLKGDGRAINGRPRGHG
jgi:hypothetical protein